MVYMPNTKFEMQYYDGPDDMFRSAMFLGIALTWNNSGDPIADPDHYEESFDVLDNWKPSNNRTGISRSECEELVHDAWIEQHCS